MPPKEENKSSDNEIEEEKLKSHPNPKNRNMTHYDNFTNYELEEDPRKEYNSTKKAKNVQSPHKKCETAMNTNTMTTFSRLNEERDDEPSHPSELFAAPDVDERVA